MATAILIHNPTAGNGEHEKKELKKQIRFLGYEVEYFSTQIPGWERFAEKDAEKIFLAGGDGTVQKLAKVLLKSEGKIAKVPVQVLPMGTANNIAKTLGIKQKEDDFSDLKSTTGFDTGEVEGVGEVNFFIEGIGAGIFPKLVKEMEAQEKEEGEPEDPAEELKNSLIHLIKIVKEYEASEAIIIADGEEITGKYLLVECMNIRYIGPNFELAPNAETGDGEFELVMIPEDSREKLLDYIQNILNERAGNLSLEDFAHLRKVTELRFKWQGEDLHIDDEVDLDYDGQEIRVKNGQGSFIFNIPD